MGAYFLVDLLKPSKRNVLNSVKILKDCALNFLHKF